MEFPVTTAEAGPRHTLILALLEQRKRHGDEIGCLIDERSEGAAPRSTQGSNPVQWVVGSAMRIAARMSDPWLKSQESCRITVS